MSQPAGTERTPAPRGGGGGGNLLTRRYGGVPGWAWVALVSLLAGGVFWYMNRRKAASASNPPAGGAGPTQATCYDANGSTVDCADPSAVGSNATDYFEALYAQQEGINSQLENLGPQITETGLDADQLQALLEQLAGSKSGGPGGPGRPGAVRNLRAEPVTATTAHVSWSPPARQAPAAGYGTPALETYTIEIQGKDKGPHNIGGRTSYNVAGLKPGGHYTAVVAAAGGPSASAAFTMPQRGRRGATPQPATKGGGGSGGPART